MAYKQRCLRWVGPYFPGSTYEERKVQVVEENNMNSNIKVVVLGPEYIGIMLREPHDGKVKRSWASPRMRSLGWNASIYDYIDRSWTVDGTYSCDQEIEYNADATGRVIVYHPARDETAPDDAPGDDAPGDDGHGDGDGGNGPGDDGPGDDVAPDENQEGGDEMDVVDEVEDTTSTPLAFEAGTVEPTDPADMPDMPDMPEIPTAHAAITSIKEELDDDKTPEQRTPELRVAKVEDEESPEKIPKPKTFTKAMRPTDPGKFIDLGSDEDDPMPSGLPATSSSGSEKAPEPTAVKLEVKTEKQPCAMLGALMSSESRVMDKKDKQVVTSGLRIMQHEDEDVTLDIDNLAEEALEPTWFYFYKAPDGKKEEKSEFAGRMLVSASMERTEKPILTINPGSIANPPKVTAGVAWIDLYMVCFDSTEQPEQLYVQIELPRIIDAEVLSSQPEPEGHGFVWKGKEIRLDHMVPNFSLPAPENCGEFIISVYAKFKKKGLLGGKKPERYMYARVPAEEVCKWDQTPRWRAHLQTKIYKLYKDVQLAFFGSLAQIQTMRVLRFPPMALRPFSIRTPCCTTVAEVELLAPLAELLMPQTPIAELFRSFPSQKGWGGNYLEPDLAAYGVLKDENARLFVEYDDYWRHQEKEGVKRDQEKNAALLGLPRCSHAAQSVPVTVISPSIN
eukprot:s1111_g12.t1